MEPAFYAPQVRLVDLASGTIIGTNVTTSGAGKDKTTTTIVSPDLISARVTLPATGIAQLQVTLNNQRFDAGKPKWPPWKYNDFSRKKATAQQDSSGTFQLTFGQRVRLDIRYSGAPWTKLIVARITDLQFSFPSSGGAQLTVVGEDLLSVLKIKPSKDIPHDDKHEDEIATRTLAEAKLEIPLRTKDLPKPAKPLRSARQQASQTYYQFLTDIADRMDCELFVDFKDPDAAVDGGPGSGGATDIKSELVVVMEPARSGTKPQTKVDDWKRTKLAPGEYLELRWGKSLIGLKPKLKVWEMPTSASGSGSHPDRRGQAKVEVTESEIKAAIEKELHKSPSYSSIDVVDAITARKDFYDNAGDPPDNNDSAHGSGLDEPRLKLKALAQVMKKVREFMTAEGSTIGVPMLRPGMYVHIIGLRPPFDGFYYVTQTAHSFDAGGYRTSFTLRRPGMLSPSGYESAANDEQAGASTP